jgi:hypothetical protein
MNYKNVLTNDDDDNRQKNDTTKNPIITRRIKTKDFNLVRLISKVDDSFDSDPEDENSPKANNDGVPNENDDINTSTVGAMSSKIFKFNERFNSFLTILFWLLFFFIVISIAIMIDSIQSRHHHDHHHTIQTESHDCNYCLENLIKLDSNLQNFTDSNDYIKLYSDKEYSHVYCHIPLTIINSNYSYLYIEQLTQGIGSRDLYYDPGSILSSSLLRFELIRSSYSTTIQSSTSDVLHMIVPVTQYIGNKAIIEKSFSSSILGSFTVLNYTDHQHILIDITEFIMTEAGFSVGQILPGLIASAFNTDKIKYHYEIDRQRSSIIFHKNHIQTNAYRFFIDSIQSYSIIPDHHNPLYSYSPPYPFSSGIISLPNHIKITVRRSFVNLNDYQQSFQTKPYQPRLYHPMSGLNSISFMNENAPLLNRRQLTYVVRHAMPTMVDSVQARVTANSMDSGRNMRGQSSSLRADLQAQAVSILYVVDANAPEPVRSALVEGIKWCGNHSLYVPIAVRENVVASR